MKPQRLRLAQPARPSLRAVDGIEVYPTSERLAEQWALAVAWLRNRPGGSRWILDKRTERKT